MDRVFAALQGEHGLGCGVLGYLNTLEAVAWRTAHRAAREAVAEFVWTDTKTRIAGSMGLWRACFPRATKANLSCRSNLRHHEFPHLVGVTWLDLSHCDCYSICNATFRFLAELRVLNLSYSWQDRTVWAFFRDAFNDHLFQHLGKLETLHMDGFLYNKFSGDFAGYLPHLRQLSIRNWTEGPESVSRFMNFLRRKQAVQLFILGCPWVYDSWEFIPRNAILSS